MRYLIALLAFAAAQFANAQTRLEIHPHPACWGDTIHISYTAQYADYVQWSTNGEGKFIKKQTAVDDTFALYLPMGKDLTQAVKITATAYRSGNKLSVEAEVNSLPLPKPEFSVDTLVDLGTKLNFYNHSTINSGGVASIEYNFGDSIVGIYYPVSYAVVQHTYKNTGTYMVTLCAISEAGCRACSKAQQIIIMPAGIADTKLHKIQIISSHGQVQLSQVPANTTLKVYDENGKECYSTQGQAQVRFSLVSQQVYIFTFTGQSGHFSTKYFVD
ncbi:hypothetical protein GC194_07890 [bacterium]|nr:hypothetical protein [bacterium]